MVFRYEPAPKATETATQAPLIADGTLNLIAPRQIAAAALAITIEASNAFWAMTKLTKPACDQAWLMERLNDPTLADNPHRIKAEARSMALDEEMRRHLTMVADSEMTASRWWIWLTPEQRAEAAESWDVKPTRKDLTWAAWTSWSGDLGLPDEFSLERILFPSLGIWPSFDPWIRDGHIALPEGSTVRHIKRGAKKR